MQLAASEWAVAMNDEFLLGVNYWPRRKAMYWWKDFDRGEVDAEFADIASMELSLVRFFLLWEDFQPAPDRVSGEALDHLAATFDCAERHGLRLMPTLLVGNMSGVLWFPEWAVSDDLPSSPNPQIVAGRLDRRGPRDLYADPAMLKAQALLARSVARRVAKHPALFGWDLANEIDQAAQPSSYDAGWLWLHTLAGATRQEDGEHPVTYGAHPRSLDRHNGLSVPDMAVELEYVSMHGYPIYSDQALGPLDPDFVPFVTWLTRALAGKPAMMQEFGLPTTLPGQPSQTIEDDFLGQKRPQFMASEEAAARYYEAVLPRLYADGALGALAWCYADYAPELWDKPPLDVAVRERSFGLVRSDGKHKPAVEVLRAFARELKTRAGRPPNHTDGTLTPALSQRERRPRVPDIRVDPGDYYTDPPANFAKLYSRYLRARQASPPSLGI